MVVVGGQGQHLPACFRLEKKFGQCAALLGTRPPGPAVMSLETAHGYLSPFHGYSGSYSDMQTWPNAHGFRLPPLIVCRASARSAQHAAAARRATTRRIS